jgi:hypothetical protein
MQGRLVLPVVGPDQGGQAQVEHLPSGGIVPNLGGDGWHEPGRCSTRTRSGCSAS